MTTSLSCWQIEHDQEISVTMTFDIDAEGNLDDGFEITRATLVELAVWLDCDQAEPAQDLCIDKTAWLNRFLEQHPGERSRLVEALAVQYDRDHADDDIYASASWREAVLLGVD